MKTRSRLSLLLLAVLLGGGLQVQATPRIGLVLSGGGARGSAHIGVLKVLEELRVPIHAIAGTSMGSLVGGAYASGLSIQEMEQRVTALNWNHLFNDDPPRSQWPARRKQDSQRPTWDFSIGRRDGEFRLPKGAMAGQKVQLFLSDLVSRADGKDSFDQLPIPFRAIATNLENGKIKVFDDGPMAEALRASMSVPGLFAPMETDGGIYVDGGLVRNLPIDVIRTMGVDVVIAVNLGSSYLQREDLGTVLGVTGQMIAILTEQNVERSLKELDPKRDLLIKPDLGDITAGDFNRAAEAIAIGEAAARAMAGALARYSANEAQYTAWHQARFQPGPLPVAHIEEVRISGLQRVNEGLFTALKGKYSDATLDRQALEQDIQALYGKGDFERISYRLAQEQQRSLLIVDALEKSWGPGYASMGIGLMSDFQGDSRFGIRGTYKETWINELGADWTTELTIGSESRLFTEFYQPLYLDRSLFVAPYLDIGRDPINIYQGDQRIARYDQVGARIGVDVGTTVAKNTELRLGVYWSKMDFSVDTGDPLLPESQVNESGIHLGLLSDTLDSTYVPRSGSRLNLDYQRPLEAFGADGEYNRLFASWHGAASRGADTLVLRLRGGSSFGDEMPYHKQFALGGFFNLAGYAHEQFRGNRMAYAGAYYYRRIAALTPPLGKGLYLGGALEYGRLWDVAKDSGGFELNLEKDRYAGSLFFGADSWLGPFYVGWGLSAEGDSSFYVLLGQP